MMGLDTAVPKVSCPTTTGLIRASAAIISHWQMLYMELPASIQLIFVLNRGWAVASKGVAIVDM